MKYTVFFYLLFFLNLSKANILCKNLFVHEQNKLEFVQVEQSSIGQKLLNVMPNINPKLWRRYWNTKETNLISSELQANTAGKTNIIRVENYGTIFSKTTIIENHLFLELIQIQIHNSVHKVNIKEQYNGVNTFLIKTLTAYFKAAAEIINKNLEIDTIYFTGINLKNPMLIEILRENNFVLERRHNQINFIKKIDLD